MSGTAAVVPMLTDSKGARVAMTVLNGPLCIALLLAGSTKTIGMALGAVVGLMTIAFGTVVAHVGAPHRFVDELLPSIPEGGAEVALGLMGTTCAAGPILAACTALHRTELCVARYGTVRLGTE